MPLFAIDEDDLIHASDAKSGKIYWCADCFGPVKKRKGKYNFSHFYHLKTTPSCRLYSKSEEHLIAQMELKKKFEKELETEKPFIQIDRVADCCWEKEKIIFEIQCSLITECEAEKRMKDYASIGYDVIWLLDDKLYNKRKIKPAEKYLRKTSCYFISIKKNAIYDQFEVFSKDQRVRKCGPLSLDPRRVLAAPKIEFDPKFYPQQIVQLKVKRHFYGDRLSRALHFPEQMQKERTLELAFQRKKSSLKDVLNKYIFRPYLQWLERILKGR